ncbi:MAG: hypothetical protein MJZ19_09510 [Paludibacteraceae bacterium]|nr:hypothetical protein [Paludibacteraceae bacterium]
MTKFNLNSLEEPTDEQLQGLMVALGEIGKKSMLNTQQILKKKLEETISASKNGIISHS